MTYGRIQIPVGKLVLMHITQTVCYLPSKVFTKVLIQAPGPGNVVFEVSMLTVFHGDVKNVLALVPPVTLHEESTILGSVLVTG